MVVKQARIQEFILKGRLCLGEGSGVQGSPPDAPGNKEFEELTILMTTV